MNDMECHLLTKKGWTLSPAYDMNPTLNEYQSLLINESSNKANIKTLQEMPYCKIIVLLRLVRT